MYKRQPIYSAIKVNGKKLYEYARNGEEVEIPTREVEINYLEIMEIKDNLIKFKVGCSKGTYIRSLCFDLAKALGYPGHMPVSYTHLDVYKRQSYDCFRYLLLCFDFSRGFCFSMFGYFIAS